MTKGEHRAIPRFNPITRSLHPPLRTILATDNEIIVLLATLQHYQICDRHANQEAIAPAIPLIQSFIQRLHDQLPLGREQIAGQ
jgi:hypothetical protein